MRGWREINGQRQSEGDGEMRKSERGRDQKEEEKKGHRGRDEKDEEGKESERRRNTNLLIPLV